MEWQAEQANFQPDSELGKAGLQVLLSFEYWTAIRRAFEPPHDFTRSEVLQARRFVLRCKSHGLVSTIVLLPCSGVPRWFSTLPIRSTLEAGDAALCRMVIRLSHVCNRVPSVLVGEDLRSRAEAAEKECEELRSECKGRGRSIESIQ